MVSKYSESKISLPIIRRLLGPVAYGGAPSEPLSSEPLPHILCLLALQWLVRHARKGGEGKKWLSRRAGGRSVLPVPLSPSVLGGRGGGAKSG